MKERGFSLIETVIAMGLMATALLGLAALLTAGARRIGTTPGDLTATQKAAEAIESVFSARDTQTVRWAQLRNVADGGIFLDGPQPLKDPGPDGLLGTADDDAVETVVLPGPDQQLGTNDDVTVTLNGFTREIQIRDVEANLRLITVIITYQQGSATRTYTLTSYISNFA
ncbi:MAG TPA: prepilin-type N-terminal cleavage/methylation domain-containing protein [Vicinamibacterales bacterium]|nr:prepilin-type N-terminal cleavage/methylation domain-containing protein [Vicinamibacterales bacterium]